MDSPSQLPLWRRYVVAVLATGIAATVRMLFDPLLGSQLPLLIFIFPVVASAWWGGVGPGLLAVGLGAITGTWLFMEPRYEFKFALLFSDLRPIVFVIASTAFTWMCSTVRMVLRREAAASQAALAQREELRREAQARAEAAAALKEFETDLQTVFQLAAVGIARGDCSDGSIVQVNQKFCDLLGYPEAELIGKTFREITHPDDREADYVAFQRVVRGEKDEFSQEKRYLRKDGSVAWGYVNARIVRGPNGEARDSFAIVVDITERKHAEKVLADRESQLRQIGDNLPQGFLYQITASPDHPRRFIYFSAGLERITGVPIAEALADARPSVDVRYSTTTRSPVLAVDDPGYAIRTRLVFPAHDDPADGPGERYAYNVVAGSGQRGFDQIVFVVDDVGDTEALAGGLLERLRALAPVLVATVPAHGRDS